MPTDTINYSNEFTHDCMKGVHDFSADAFKVILSNTAPDAGDNVAADITEITAENGYTAGGIPVVVASTSQASGIASAIFTDKTVTATGGSFGPWRYLVLINSTDNRIVGWFDYGESVTTAEGEDLVINFPDGGTVIIGGAAA